MKVVVAKKRGFCAGVERAMEMADQLLSEHKKVYCLGALIHNEQAVARLERAGLQVVNCVDEISAEELANGEEPPTVLIRSHGCPPEILDEVRARGFVVADATCVLVKRLQKLVAKCADDGYQVVIVGDPNHPEVRAAMCYASDVAVVASQDDLGRLPKTGRLAVLSQTTHSIEDFGRIVGLIAAKGYQEIKVVNTICRETARRQEAAVELCEQVDVVFVLGGKHSANTGELAELCRRHGIETHHLEDYGEFRPQYVEGKAIAGVTAGASTPEWVIQQFVEGLEGI